MSDPVLNKNFQSFSWLESLYSEITTSFCSEIATEDQGSLNFANGSAASQSQESHRLRLVKLPISLQQECGLTCKMQHSFEKKEDYLSICAEKEIFLAQFEIDLKIVLEIWPEKEGVRNSLLKSIHI